MHKVENCSHCTVYLHHIQFWHVDTLSSCTYIHTETTQQSCILLNFVFSESSLVRAAVLTPWAIKTSSWTWSRWFRHCPPPTSVKTQLETMVGPLRVRTHTHTQRHTRGHMVSPLCMKKHMYMHDTQTQRVNWAADAHIPPSVLSPWRHQWQHAKNTLPMILSVPLSMCLTVCACVLLWKMCFVISGKQAQCNVENLISTYLLDSKGSDSV